MRKEELIAKSDAAVEQVKPLLGGLGPAVQGAVVAELAALWIAGHQRELREEMMDLHFKTVRKLAPILAAKLWREP